MSEQKFHVENWVKHYQSKLSDDSLASIIEGYGEGAFVRCYGSDDILEINVSLQLYDYCLNNVYVNKETDEEIDVEFEVDASIHFNVEYQMLFDEIDVEECQEALNNAIDHGESTFTVSVEVKMKSVSDINIDIDSYQSSEEIDENEVYRLIYECFGYDPSESQSQSYADNIVQQSTNKYLQFTCTIAND